MASIQLDIDLEQFQDELVTALPTPSSQTILTLIANLVVEQFKRRLEGLVISGKALRFKVEWFRPAYILDLSQTSYLDPVKLPTSLRELINQKLIDLGDFFTTVVTQRDNCTEICFVPPTNLCWENPPEIKRISLKTIDKHTIRMRSLLLQAKDLVPVSYVFGAPCKCPSDLLLPYIDGVWDWALRFVCKVCGKSYFCECFRTALEKHYLKALSEQNHYAEGGWPHKFIATYQQSQFREGICHLCLDVASDLFYCHPMYGSKVRVHYGPYIVRTAIEKDITQREAENEIRDLLGIPRIGEGWISEVELLNLVREILPGKEVIHQASPEWLKRQRLDIYISSLKLAIEYQGRQHYEAVEFFGGEEGLQKTQKRDGHKAEICRANGITLIYFRYNETITGELVKQRIAANLPEARAKFR